MHTGTKIRSSGFERDPGTNCLKTIFTLAIIVSISFLPLYIAILFWSTFEYNHKLVSSKNIN